MIALLAGGFVISSFACLGAVSRLPEQFPAMPTTAKLILSYIALTLAVSVFRGCAGMGIYAAREIDWPALRGGSGQ